MKRGFVLLLPDEAWLRPTWLRSTVAAGLFTGFLGFVVNKSGADFAKRLGFFVSGRRISHHFEANASGAVNKWLFGGLSAWAAGSYIFHRDGE
jgi:hypothetical protein